MEITTEYYDDRAPSRGYARPPIRRRLRPLRWARLRRRAADSRSDLRGEPADYHHRDIAAGTRTNRPREFDRAEMTRPPRFRIVAAQPRNAADPADGGDGVRHPLSNHHAAALRTAGSAPSVSGSATATRSSWIWCRWTTCRCQAAGRFRGPAGLRAQLVRQGRDQVFARLQASMWLPRGRPKPGSTPTNRRGLAAVGHIGHPHAGQGVARHGCGHAASPVGWRCRPSWRRNLFFILLRSGLSLVVFSDPWVRAIHLLAAADRSGRR